MTRLKDSHLAKIGGKLSVKGLKMMSVVYGMGLEQHELEDIDSEGRGDKEGKKRTILIKWRNSKGGKKEDLANILYTAGQVDEKEIRTHLELPEEFEFTDTELPKPGTGQKLQQRELGILAWKTERADMRHFAVTSLGCSDAEVSNITSDNLDSWSTVFEILVQWSHKKGNTRQKLINELKEAGIDPELIQEVLGGDINNSRDKVDSTGASGACDKTDYSIPPTEKLSLEKKDTWIKTGFGLSFIVVLTISVLTITGSLSPDNQNHQPKKDHIYPMETNPKGYVLIVNNKVFYNDPGSRNTRHGTDNDVERLKQVFEKLGYVVEEKKDLTASEIGQQMKTFAQLKKHDTASASVVVVLSHGRNGAIIGTDGEEAQIDRLINEFSSDNSRVLAGKPKLFLFQACRGGRKDLLADNLENEMELHREHITKMGRIIPRLADTIVGYATDPDYLSYRRTTGSIFIQTFCDVVDEYGNTTDLLSITTKVNAKMAEKGDLKDPESGEMITQMSEFISKLTKTWNLSSTSRSQRGEL